MTYYTSKAKLVGILVGMVILIIGCFWLATSSDVQSRTIGWTCIVFFSLCAIGGIRQLHRTGARLTIDDIGIHDHVSPIGTIPWSDIISLQIIHIRSAPFLKINVSNPNVYVSRLPTYSRALAHSSASLGIPLSISLVALTPNPDERWKYIQAHHADKLGKAMQSQK